MLKLLWQKPKHGKISSTRIRKAVEEGDIAQANETSDESETETIVSEESVVETEVPEEVKEEVEFTDEANTTDDFNEESAVEAPKADDSEIFPELDSKAPAETAEVDEKDNQETIDLSELKN